MLRWLLPFAAFCTMAACSGRDSQPGPGGVTVGEARALSDAAEMIEGRRPAASEPISPKAR